MLKLFGSLTILTLLTSTQGPPRAHAATSKNKIRVPFVGCKSDGHVGPLGAPTGLNKLAEIPYEAAKNLAYYEAEEGPGVLAPRGWYCFATYGANGATLYVAPRPLDSAEMFSDKWRSEAGPAVIASVEIGDTSGRFGVAKVIARVFPAYHQFVRAVIEENIEPANSFPSGPYPDDKLTYRGKNIVEYVTPGNTEGLGTARLRKNAERISGVAILVGQTPDLLSLQVRTSPDGRQLATSIIQQFESDAAN